MSNGFDSLPRGVFLPSMLKYTSNCNVDTSLVCHVYVCCDETYWRDCVGAKDASAQHSRDVKAHFLRLLRVEWIASWSVFKCLQTSIFGSGFGSRGLTSVEYTPCLPLLRFKPPGTRPPLVDAVFKVYVPSVVQLFCVVLVQYFLSE